MSDVDKIEVIRARFADNVYRPSNETDAIATLLAELDKAHELRALLVGMNESHEAVHSEWFESWLPEVNEILGVDSDE